MRECAAARSASSGRCGVPRAGRRSPWPRRAFPRNRILYFFPPRFIITSRRTVSTRATPSMNRASLVPSSSRIASDRACRWRTDLMPLRTHALEDHHPCRLADITIRCRRIWESRPHAPGIILSGHTARPLDVQQQAEPPPGRHEASPNARDAAWSKIPHAALLHDHALQCETAAYCSPARCDRPRVQAPGSAVAKNTMPSLVSHRRFRRNRRQFCCGE